MVLILFSWFWLTSIKVHETTVGGFSLPAEQKSVVVGGQHVLQSRGELIESHCHTGQTLQHGGLTTVQWAEP